MIVAYAGRTELTIGVAVGSSIQIAAGMIPILVLVSWILHKNLTLFFADFEVSRIRPLRVATLHADREWLIQTIVLFISGT